MKTFYEMMMLMEQAAQLARVENFPHDFEQVLNFVAGGHWNFIADNHSPIVSVTNLMGDLDYYMLVRYRGMSESGRHYETVVGLYNQVGTARGNRVFEVMKTWKQNSSYSPAGSQGVAEGSPNFYFMLHEIQELGPDTDGRPKRIPDERTDWDRSEEEKNLTTAQRDIQTILDKLGELERDIPKRSWTPKRDVYHWGDKSTKNARPVDLAKQIKDEIAKYEKSSPGWNSHQ
jgi:hypothetical protein